MIRGFLFVLAFLASGTTFASSQICSGERLYLRSVTNDFGIKPPVGSVLGRETIQLNGDTIQDYTRVEGLRPNGIPSFQMNFEGSVTVLEKTGSHSASKVIYKQVMVLNEYDSRTMELIREIAREDVVCKSTSVQVP
ncbi:MAG: hypothetical protein NTV34_05695 [Proteobacteria bacterium]|nr:hypothetical protein [Pseudomonadota bacterium]